MFESQVFVIQVLATDGVLGCCVYGLILLWSNSAALCGQISTSIASVCGGEGGSRSDTSLKQHNFFG